VVLLLRNNSDSPADPFMIFLKVSFHDSFAFRDKKGFKASYVTPENLKDSFIFEFFEFDFFCNETNSFTFDL